MEKKITIAISAKWYKARRGISLCNKEKRCYESDIGNESDLDQPDNTYPYNSKKQWEITYREQKWFVYLFIFHLFMKLIELFVNKDVFMIIIE